MKKKQLEILLERVKGFQKPDATKEQYQTPAPIAAEVLYTAYLRGELREAVIDLGCGTGILGIGAELLGAKKVLGTDNDVQALKTAHENATNLGCTNIGFAYCQDISQFCATSQTVIMNPPFGAQIKGSDRPFLKKATKISDIIYTIHNKGSSEFVEKYIAPAIITDIKPIKFPIDHTFKFHTKKRKLIDAEVYRIETNR